MNFRAMVCTALTGPGSLQLQERPAPALESGQIRIAVRASGVNYPDLLMTYGRYQLRLQPPFIPGMEVAGEVIETGPGVNRVATGDRVIASTRAAGYAEQVVAAEDAIMPLPPGFSFAEGATFTVAGRTAFHALVDRGQLASGETLLVLGATGGVGLTAVELGKLLGARVIAVGSSDRKLAIARERGADAVVNYREQEFRSAVRALVGEAGVDVVYDPVGGTLSTESARLLAWGGRLLIVGFASGSFPELRANHALIKGYSVIGVRAGESARRNPEQARHGLEALFRLAAQGHLRPHICRTYPLRDAAEALRGLESRGVVGRIALIPGP
ncbi:MAG: NADPH:quinone oxidoreductase family protein [Ectothiorhodospiraceae bacterium]|nr:NADPH:quinone oxidoreductase family protein [Ectothiorhodospiraceae bacterium]